MGKKEKLLQKLKNNPTNVKFETLQSLLLHYGFKERTPRGGSSHFTYTFGKHIITIPKHKPVKTIYVKKVLSISKTFSLLKRSKIMKDINYYKKINYPLTVLQEEDGSYFAEYPDLKGCMTVADTFQEIYEMAEDAKIAWLETALENNIPIPAPKDVSSYSGNFKLRIPKSLHKQLAEEAKAEGISMNQLCVYLLSRELEHIHKA